MMMRRKQIDRRSRPFLSRSLGASGLLVALALAGCANSPDSQYYTLGSGGAGAIPTGSATAGRGSDPARPLLIEMTPVNIPDQVARPQIVTTSGDGKVDIHDYQRWSGPLADEIGGALSTSLTRSLGAIDVYRAPRPTGATVYQITVNVRRFESIVGEHATIDAVWSVVRSSDHLTMTCQTTATEPVSSGFESLVAGHRKALARVAANIDTAIQQERAVPVQIPADDMAANTDSAAKNASGHKTADGKKPADAGSNATMTGKVGTRNAPILPCPTNAAPSA
jgi:uncharacterized lipoprotein YmbA